VTEDASVATYRPVEALWVAVDAEDEVVQVLAPASGIAASRRQ
jgi:hypothetical protein